MVYMVGKPRISASIWHQAIEIWSILQAVRISGTHPDRPLNSSWHCVVPIYWCTLPQENIKVKGAIRICDEEFQEIYERAGPHWLLTRPDWMMTSQLRLSLRLNGPLNWCWSSWKLSYPSCWSVMIIQIVAITWYIWYVMKRCNWQTRAPRSRSWVTVVLSENAKSGITTCGLGEAHHNLKSSCWSEKLLLELTMEDGDNDILRWYENVKIIDDNLL